MLHYLCVMCLNYVTASVCYVLELCVITIYVMC